MQLKDVKSAASLKVKKVHSSFLGLSGNREVWGIYAGNQPIYRTKRGGMEGTAYYKLSADGAKVMLKELQAAVEEEKATAKTSRATKTTQKSAAAPKPRAASAAPSAALTVSGCSKFLRDKGYSVSKKKAAKRKDAEVDDLADYYTSLGAENNPRRRLSRRRLNNPSKRTRKKSFRDNAQFLRELKKAAKAQDLRIELYGTDGIEFIDTLTEASTGTIRLEQPASPTGLVGGESDFSLFLDVSFGGYWWEGGPTMGHLGLLTADAVGRRAARTQQMSMAELAKAVVDVAGFLGAGHALENIPDEMGTPQFQVLSYADRYELGVPLVVEGFESNPRRRRRKNRSNVPSADRGGTYVMFWDDPNGPDPIVFTSSKGEDATYKAIQSDALYDYEDRAYGQIKPMRADAALLLLEQQMLRADSDGYDEGQRYQYNRVLAAVNAYKRRVTPAQAKKKVQTALRDFVHPFEEGPVYGNPRALRRLR